MMKTPKQTRDYLREIGARGGRVKGPSKRRNVDYAAMARKRWEKRS